MLPELKIGVAVILRQKQRVLMGKRIGSHGANTWSFPGGHIEFNETAEEAAWRELREETGIEFAGEFRPYGWVENHFEADGKRYITLYLEGRVVGYTEPKAEIREPTKCEEWRWVDVWDLPTPRFAPVEKFLQLGLLGT